MAQNGPFIKRHKTCFPPRYQNDTWEESTAARLAKQYNVSNITIKRDSRIAEAINAIGEKSPEAKRNILSGKVGITRKQLNEILKAESDDIQDIADKIVEGSFDTLEGLILLL